MIEGHKELGRKFATLEQIADQQMERIVKNQLKHVQAAAKLLCPVSQGELRNSIRSSVQRVDDRVVGAVYTNKAYAPYVEFGTGPKGEADHAGISPAVSPAYSQSPWWTKKRQSGTTGSIWIRRMDVSTSVRASRHSPLCIRP